MLLTDVRIKIKEYDNILQPWLLVPRHANTEHSGAQLHGVCLLPEEKLNRFGGWDGMQSCPGRKEVKGDKCMCMCLLS